MRTRLCCKESPILIEGSLAFVCQHNLPRVILHPDGFFFLKAGEKVIFNDLRTIGTITTDKYGVLNNYSLHRE